ncbi:MAG: DUF2752 domain-containing protein [Planctomycetes bacterium]|nr:DUF2752 domain-containing protein [Planctomycetota bacterium]
MTPVADRLSGWRAVFRAAVPTLGVRIVGACVACGGAALLGVARYITPDASGMGSHTQLGMMKCGFHAVTGIPCATCGMTTAFAHAVRGNLWRSFVTQPAGAVLAVLTAAAVLVGLYVAVTGVKPPPVGQLLWRPRTVLVFGLFVLAAWVYKIIVVCGTPT